MPWAIQFIIWSGDPFLRLVFQQSPDDLREGEQPLARMSSVQGVGRGKTEEGGLLGVEGM